MSAPAFYDELRALRLERILDASVAIITEEGWDRLSMTKVAQRSGVPRQSLYKEVGTKSELGEAVIHREVERFLAGVREGIAAHPGDSVEEGLGAAARFALEYGETNAVLKSDPAPRPRPRAARAAHSASGGGAGPGLARGQRRARRRWVGGEVDTMVRLTLSHLLQPTVSIDDAVDRIQHAVGGCRMSRS